MSAICDARGKKSVRQIIILLVAQEVQCVGDKMQ